ncbi:histidine kinase [Noviherbaspirillum denitrificans]|uniref:Histidine kinase n=1 Tax=Noviherbaspirillum denitrificans TaxID=1968433 RepID=A0A254TK80_9BURK|nr:histidine kinase [Noviherbaspirillum denitrificans]
MFRTLVGVNVAAFAGIVAQSAGWQSGVREFVEASLVVELACLWALFALCGVRQLLLRQVGAKGFPMWGQRALSMAVPVAVTAVVMQLSAPGSGLAVGFGSQSPGKAMLLAAVFGAFFQHYFELRKRAYSPALVEARLQALQARIRPHFLYNSLNAALSLIRTEPRQAESTLEDLADLFRVLMSDPRSMTSLENEIRLCQQYLSIEKIRLGDRMQVRWELDGIDSDTLRRMQVPVLLLQPLIENAVHYGVEPAVEPALVQVTVARFMDKIAITVINPYHGATGDAGNRMALANIRERLSLLFDVEAMLSTAVNGKVFEARLLLPYAKGVA